MLEKQAKRYRRHKRVRAKIHGTAKVPRFSVFRSNKYIYAQLIDDEKGQTLVAASDREIKKAKIPPQRGEARSIILSDKNQKSKIEIKKKKTDETKKPLTANVATAYEVGKLIAQKAQKKKIKKVVFDKGGYKYHGRVKAVAEGAREEGLKF